MIDQTEKKFKFVRILYQNKITCVSLKNEMTCTKKLTE